MKVFIVVVLILSSLVSCKENKELKEIKLSEVFEIEIDKYCILFYSSSCPSCIGTIEILNKRYKIRKYAGFLVNLKGLNISFSEEKVTNVDKKHIDELVFYTVPYLVYISKNVIEKEVYGYTNIHKENLYIFFE